MRTIFVLISVALCACNVNAQFTRRIGGFSAVEAKEFEQLKKQAAQDKALAAVEARRMPNFAQSFFDAPLTDLARVTGGKPVSLKPLVFWRNAGQAYWNAYQPFSVTNPLPQWIIVEGKVSSLCKDGTVMLWREPEIIALLNWPGSAGAITDQGVRVMSVAAGRYSVGTAAYAAYDYGTRPTSAQLDVLEKQDAAAEAARAEVAAKLKSAAAEAEARRKAEIAARVAKARADRAAKEKLEAGK